MFLQQARTAADRAFALDELLADARVSRGLVAMERGETEKAEMDFQAALALDGNLGSVYLALGATRRPPRGSRTR